ncbi:DUF5131 family protein [Aromatoleum evansii]|uniref:DUF5131 family protein n=1 Tax=Aromatoleum evansii TaxID=59406 RepID=UPI00145CA390|nr:phage Gp37/Gp68 family protein [Aromatoleum evansii]NMG30598.1 DUF5131 family protein [Aromatoleum evansii]
MADNSRIEWTDATWNPITGCSVLTAGCTNCYAMKLAGTRLQMHPSRAGLTDPTAAGPVWNGEVRLNAEWLDMPIRWSRRRMIFVCAHGDLFHPSVPDAWIDTVFGIMWACLYGRNGEPGHIFQVLTKRAERMHAYLSVDRREAWARAAVRFGGGHDPDGLYDQVALADGPHPRIWLGVTAENQATADNRIPLLLHTPAAVRWVSAEPLLGPLDLAAYLMCLCGKCGGDAPLHWVVAGGESGPRARPMHEQWVRGLRDQCAEASVPFLFKQWGEWLPMGQQERSREYPEVVADRANGAPASGYPDTRVHVWSDGTESYRAGKRSSGRHLDGALHDGYPVQGLAAGAS